MCARSSRRFARRGWVLGDFAFFVLRGFAGPRAFVIQGFVDSHYPPGSSLTRQGQDQARVEPYRWNMIANPNILIADFVRVARIAGCRISEEEIDHQVLRAPHLQPSLRKGWQAVYVFSMPTSPLQVLKVGKAGPNSNARFQFQHYNPQSAPSNLAKSLISQKDTWTQLGIQSLDEGNVGQWIQQYVDRDNFFLKAGHGSLLLSLLEVFLQCRLQPIFEG